MTNVTVNEDSSESPARRFEAAQARDMAAWEKLRDDVRTQHAGKYVGLAQGRIVAASPSFDDVVAALERLHPKPAHMLVFPAEEEPPFAVVEVNHAELAKS